MTLEIKCRCGCRTGCFVDARSSSWVCPVCMIRQRDELLEACKEALGCLRWRDGVASRDTLVDMLERAIAAAEGKP